MTITRIWQAGAESNGLQSNLYEFHTIYGLSTLYPSTNYVKTGTYSFLIDWDSWGLVNIPATRQIRTGFHFIIPDTAPSAGNSLLLTHDALGNVLFTVYFVNASTIGIWTPSANRDSASFTISKISFVHMGIDVKIDPTNGWIVVYLDGIEMLRFEGNTGNADIISTTYGNRGGIYEPARKYYDDLFIDDTTGQGAAAPVPDRRFYPITPNGAGAYNHGIGSDGNSVNNHLLVDERPHNSDTDYVYLKALDEKELNLMTTYTPPTGFTFAALIPFVYAKKTDAEVGTQLAPLLYTTSGSDLLGTAQNLPTSYGYLWERFTTKPGGGAWDQAGIDDVQVGFQGKGTF